MVRTGARFRRKMEALFDGPLVALRPVAMAAARLARAARRSRAHPERLRHNVRAALVPGPYHRPAASAPPPPSDVTLIAFYLPQFHPIPENDSWWGKGFTEWTNVTRALPMFEGHVQPRRPGDLGYYDLRVPEVLAAQVELAKRHGIGGFSFYYYWFAGRRLLDRPLQDFLARPSLDMPFCLTWVNESWTRRWDGNQQAEILLEHRHDAQLTDEFFRDVLPYFRDPRYIKVDGKPVLLIYRPSLLQDPYGTRRRWDELAKEAGFPGLFVVSTTAHAQRFDPAWGFDAEAEFAGKNHWDVPWTGPFVPLDSSWAGRAFDYAAWVEQLVEDGKRPAPHLRWRGVMVDYDNTARRRELADVFVGATPPRFAGWLREAVRDTRAQLPADRRFIFVFAWNEWAEAGYLEPDVVNGHAYLQACRDALVEP